LLLESVSAIALELQPVFGELAILILSLNKALERRLSADDNDRFFCNSYMVKEKYRLEVQLGIEGSERDLTHDQIVSFLENCLAVIDLGLNSKWTRDAAGVPRTYYITDIVEHAVPKRAVVASDGGAHQVKPVAHNYRPMAPFLEGPVHMLRVHPEQARSVYDAVRESELFDRELQMYRCCAWLKDEPLEIGRIKSYARGWIENESIYAHMEYKWLLEVLRSGLHEEFFNDIQRALVPFLDPAIYGRSLLENCSFIASSVFPDSRSHGRAFQPRLSGVTCEMLNIWTLMVAGEQPFYLDDNGELALRLHPILHERFFTSVPTARAYWDVSGEHQKLELPENSFAFKFLGHTLVIYSNPVRRSTFGENGARPVEYRLSHLDGTTQRVEGDSLDRLVAEAVREGKVSRIEVLLQ
jgi:hypothetical protein